MFGGEIGLTKMPNNTNTFMDSENNKLFEFTDNNSQVIVDNLPTEYGITTPLWTIFEHQQLYKNYPALKNIQVLFLPKEGTDYEQSDTDFVYELVYERLQPKSPKGYQIKIFSDRHRLPDQQRLHEDAELRASYMHIFRRGVIAEIQHAIQLIEFGKTEPGRAKAQEFFSGLVREAAAELSQLELGTPQYYQMEYTLKELFDDREKIIDRVYEQNYYEQMSRSSVERIELTEGQRLVTAINRPWAEVKIAEPRARQDRSSIFKSESKQDKNAE